MKRIPLISAIGVVCLFLTVSCVSIPKQAYEMEVNYIDYNIITSKTGVFLTEATSISQPYEGMGSIYAFVQDGYEVINITQVNDTMSDIDPLYVQTATKKKNKIKYGDYKIASPSEAVFLAAKKAKEKGANGIINLQMKSYPGERTGYVVTGMAVKIQ